MKKIKCFIVLLLSICCLTGCGESAEKILEDTLVNMRDLKTLKMTLKAEVGSSLYSLEILEEGTYAENSSYIKTTTSIVGNESINEAYSLKKDGKIYTYHKEAEKEVWKYNIKELQEDNDDLSAVKTIADNYKTVKKVKSEKSGYTKLEVTLDNSKTPSLLGEDEKAEGFDFSKDLILDLYIKVGYIAIIKIDLSNILTEDYAEDITKYTMRFELSDYNKVKEIEIPKDILDKAKLEEE